MPTMDMPEPPFPLDFLVRAPHTYPDGDASTPAGYPSCPTSLSIGTCKGIEPAR
jgi:hypothetical protein